MSAPSYMNGEKFNAVTDYASSYIEYTQRNNFLDETTKYAILVHNKTAGIMKDIAEYAERKKASEA